MRHVNSSDFKTHLGEYLELVADEPVTVNKLGQPAAVLLSVTEYAYLRGLDELFRAAREAEAATGRPLGHDEVTALLLGRFGQPE
jgi:prevent-host-death family protein